MGEYSLRALSSTFPGGSFFSNPRGICTDTFKFQKSIERLQDVNFVSLVTIYGRWDHCRLQKLKRKVRGRLLHKYRNVMIMKALKEHSRDGAERVYVFICQSKRTSKVTSPCMEREKETSPMTRSFRFMDVHEHSKP